LAPSDGSCLPGSLEPGLPGGVKAAPGKSTVVKFVIAVINELEELSSHTFVIGLEGLSPIEVWDVLGGGTHDGHGTG